MELFVLWKVRSLEEYAGFRERSIRFPTTSQYGTLFSGWSGSAFSHISESHKLLGDLCLYYSSRVHINVLFFILRLAHNKIILFTIMGMIILLLIRHL